MTLFKRFTNIFGYTTKSCTRITTPQNIYGQALNMKHKLYMFLKIPLI